MPGPFEIPLDLGRKFYLTYNAVCQQSATVCANWLIKIKVVLNDIGWIGVCHTIDRKM